MGEGDVFETSIRKSTFCAAVVAATTPRGLKVPPAKEFYVSPSGSDANPGTLQAPFATLNKCKEAAKTVVAGRTSGNIAAHAILRNDAKHHSVSSAPPAGPIMCYVLQGQFFNASGGPVLHVTAEDSGAVDNPIIFQAYETETVELTAGVSIPSQYIHPESSIPGAYRVHLPSLNITNYGQVLGDYNKLELFMDGVPMWLARYPNIEPTTGMWQWLNISYVVSPTTSFGYYADLDARAKRWSTEVGSFFLHGYWEWDWSESYVEVTDMNLATRLYTTTTVTSYQYSAHHRYYALNLLCELDQAGEYYLNRTSGDLYFIPLSPLTVNSTLSVSMNPNVIVMDPNVQNVQISGMKIQYSRSTAIVASGVQNVHILDCDINNHGAHGVVLTGYNNSLESCTISGTGAAAASVGGGDTPSLTPGNNRASGNNIQRYARWQRTYQPGIGFSGVGNVYSSNLISNGPHNGFLGGCNNCIFEENTLSTLCYETTDAGAWYAGRNWYHRGNIIRYNTFENILTQEKTFQDSAVNAVYFDDQLSGDFVFGNIFENCDIGVHLGGGRRLMVQFNRFVNCKLAVHLDNRGETWQTSYCTPPNGTFEQELNELHYQSPPWSTAYPELVNIVNDHPCVPVYNHVTNNTAEKCGQFIDAKPEQWELWLDTVGNNTITATEHFRSPRGTVDATVPAKPYSSGERQPVKPDVQGVLDSIEQRARRAAIAVGSDRHCWQRHSKHGTRV